MTGLQRSGTVTMDEKRRAGRGHSHVPTDALRKQVEGMGGTGSPHTDIATVLGISVPTLHKHYRTELNMGLAKAHLKARQTLFEAGVIEKNPALLIWYCKTQLGMSEKTQLEVTGKDGGPLQVETEQRATEALTHIFGQIAAAKASLH